MTQESYLTGKYEPRVVIYERKMFIRLATDWRLRTLRSIGATPHAASRDVTSALSNFYGGENRLLVFLGKYSGATLKINVDDADDGGGED